MNRRIKLIRVHHSQIIWAVIIKIYLYFLKKLNNKKDFKKKSNDYKLAYLTNEPNGFIEN